MTTLRVVSGHIIARDGIKVDLASMELTINLPPPTTVKEIR